MLRHAWIVGEARFALGRNLARREIEGDGFALALSAMRAGRIGGLCGHDLSLLSFNGGAEARFRSLPPFRPAKRGGGRLRLTTHIAPGRRTAKFRRAPRRS